MASGEPESGELDLRGMPVARDDIEVRRTKASAFAALFGTQPERPRVGRFEVLHRVGQGGMGIVYAARDPQLQRNVALKVVRPDSGGTGTRASVRMLKEARAAARLSHPNVVTVYEVGEDEGGIHIAMELLDAITLRRHAANLRDDWRGILRAYLSAGAGLAAAHRAELVHRDFKPDNVLVATDGRICVTDFGLAMLRDEVETTGEVGTPGPAGTVPYMAPEQLRGDPTTPATDQFSFCVALWEALWGKRPFPGDKMKPLLAAIEAGTIVEPPDMRGVPASIAIALRRGLHADPRARHPDMDALLSALAVVLRPRSRAPWLLAGGITAAAIAFALGVRADDRECSGGEQRIATAWNADERAAIEAAFSAVDLPFAGDSQREVERRLDDWAPLWVDAHREACTATRIRGEASQDAMDRRMACLDRGLAQVGALVGVLARADDEVVRASGTAVANLPSPADCNRDDEAFRMQWPLDAEARARVEATFAEIDRAQALRWAGKAGDGLPVVEAAVADAEAQGHDPSLAAALLERGHIEVALARHDPAGKSFDAAIDRAGASGDVRLVAEAAIALAHTVGAGQGKPSEGQVLARAAWIAVASAGSTAELRAAILRVESRLAYGRGDYEAAFEHAEAALRLLEQERGPEHLDTADALNALGNAAQGRGEFVAAGDAHGRALAIREAVLGLDHPVVADSLQNFGVARMSEGRIDEAEGHYRRALTIREAALGRMHPGVADVVANLGHVAALREQPEVALASFERARSIFEATYGPDHPRVANMLNNLAGAADQLGRLDESLAYDERALAIYARIYEENHPHVAITLTRMGEVRHRQGRIAEATELLSRALAIREASLGKDHPQVARSLFALAKVELDRGARKDAISHLERALALTRGVVGFEGLVEEASAALAEARDFAPGRP